MMSALTPKADIDWRLRNVRFVPIADSLIDLVLLDEFVCSPDKAVGDVETECFGGLQIAFAFKTWRGKRREREVG